MNNITFLKDSLFETVQGTSILLKALVEKIEFTIKDDDIQDETKEVINKINNEIVDLQNPTTMPDPSQIKFIEEPWINATIITPDEYLGSINVKSKNYYWELLGVWLLTKGSIFPDWDELSRLRGLKISLPLNPKTTARKIR